MGKTVANLALRAANPPIGIITLSLLLILGVLGRAATAQVVPAASGTDTTIETVGDRIDISGGQLSSNQGNLFHSFEQFDVTATQTVNFETIPGVQNVFGRIDSAIPSVIDGLLKVSGSSANLYLINPAGIFMGPNAGLNLSGGFTATTSAGVGFEHGQLNAATDKYSNLTGTPETFHFDTDETGSIVNLGDLQVDSGSFINLIGGTVINAGSLHAPEGTVTLAAVEGNQWVRLNQNSQLLALEVQANNDALLNSTETGFSEIAPSDLGALLTGSQLSHANTLFTDSDGNIRLGSTAVTEAGGHTYVQGNISVAGEMGGSINVLGDRIALIDASIDASGNSGGGQIRVGGNYQGSGPLHTAEQTLVDSQSILMADAGEQGNGGNIVVWSDNSTEFYGHVSAQGGSTGGDGGFAEVSGKRSLVMAGSADLSTQQGDFGTLLLDPDNVEITDGVFEDADALQLSSSYVENLFNTTNLEISAIGNIRIHDVDRDTLTVEPNRSVVFRADADEDNNGDFTMDESIAILTEGGSVSIFGAGIEAGQIETATSDGSDGGDVTLNSSQGISVGTINTSSSISKNNAGTAGSISLIAGDGDIVATGDIRAQSETQQNNADSGGMIRLEASDNIIVQNIVTSSVAGNNNAMSGGGVVLLAGGDIVTGDIDTQSTAGFQNAMSGGDVSATSSSGGITLGAIATTSGSVSLEAPKEISVRFIDARGNNNHIEPTAINISTAQTFRATETIPGTDSSLSTLETTDGDITIRYNNSADTPFVVGDATFNGTDGDISSPTGTIENGSYLGTAPTAGTYSDEYTQSNNTLIHTNSLFTEKPERTETPTEPEILQTVVSLSSEQLNRTVADFASAISISSEAGLAATLNEDDNSGDSSQTTAGNFSVFDSSEDVVLAFEQTEQGINSEFREYLGLSNDGSSVKPTELEDVQQTLISVEQQTGQKPALVYFYFVPATPDRNGAQNPLKDEGQTTNRPDDVLEILLITGSSAPVRQRQQGITRAQVEQMGLELRQSVTSLVSTRRQYLAPAQQLYSWLISPIETALEEDNVDSIGFVLDTGIRTIPWASLHDGEQFLIENYSVGLLPSFALTDFSERAYESTFLNRASVLAMGASRFENQPHLPAVDAELYLIANHLGEGVAYLNEHFILDNLQTQIQNKDYDILHLATHANFESDSLEDSYIQLWDERLALSDMDSLELSGADIELMILSACRTAMGDAASEYGFAGFAVRSGAKSALASLWPVSDEGTLGFMTQLYDQLSRETTRAESLRQAQLSMMRGEIGISDGRIYGPDYKVLTTIPELTESGRWDFSHPFYWSAFTMIGNPW